MTSVAHQKLQNGSRAAVIFKDLVSRPSGAIGLSLVIFHVVLALISPLVVPFDYKLQNSALMLVDRLSEVKTETESGLTKTEQ